MFEIQGASFAEKYKRKWKILRNKANFSQPFYESAHLIARFQIQKYK